MNPSIHKGFFYKSKILSFLIWFEIFLVLVLLKYIPPHTTHICIYNTHTHTRKYYKLNLFSDKRERESASRRAPRFYLHILYIHFECESNVGAVRSGRRRLVLFDINAQNEWDILVYIHTIWGMPNSSGMDITCARLSIGTSIARVFSFRVGRTM